MGDNGDRAQGSSVIPCAALCHKCLTHSPASRRQCGQQWPACRRAQPRGPPCRRPRRRLRACRRPYLRRARRRSGRKGRGLQGDEGGKEPWWGRERGRKREDRRRQGRAGQRGWRLGQKGKGRGRGKGQREGQGRTRSMSGMCVSAANPHLLRFSQICPRLTTFWSFSLLRRNRRLAAQSQDQTYIFLICRI